MLLSIIVPVYNVEAYLEKCIDSILRQNYRDFELILVNDGSTDSSPAICKRYEAKDDRVRLVSKENGGLVSARKTGLQHAKGEYVGMIDGDDWIDEDYYAKLMDGAVKEDADVAVCDNLVDYGDHTLTIRQGFPCGVYDKKRLREEVYPNLAFREPLFTLGFSPSLCTKVIRRELLIKHENEVDDCIRGGEDAACSYPCILDAEKLVYVDNCCGYHYLVHSMSMTHRKQILNLRERICLLSHISRAFGKFSHEGVQRQIVWYCLPVLEELVLNYFTNKIYRDDKRMQELLTILREHSVWEQVQTECERDKLPKSTVTVLDYIAEPKRTHFIRVYQIVKMRQLKAGIKKVLVKLKLYGR